MNGILVLPTRLLCGLLLAVLALAAHSDSAAPHAFRRTAVHFEQGNVEHGKSSPLTLAVATLGDDDDADQSGADPSCLQLTLRAFVVLPGAERLGDVRLRPFVLVRHAPCAAPQTGPPDLHAA
jgi:hypothetical protein